jgi:hypothetical protein
MVFDSCLARAIAQPHLAAHPEGALHEHAEWVFLFGCDEGSGEWGDAHDRALHLGRRRECARRHAEQHFGPRDGGHLTARSIGGGSKAGSEAANDFGKPGYGGPCPPTGHGPHHYHFKLFALSVDKLGLSADPKVLEGENAAEKHAIARGELLGTYERR